MTIELNDSFCSGAHETLIDRLEDYIRPIEEENKKELRGILNKKGNQFLIGKQGNSIEFSQSFYNNLSNHHRLARTLDTYLPEGFYEKLFDAAMFRSTTRWAESYPGLESYEMVINDAKEILSDVKTQFPSIENYANSIFTNYEEGVARVKEKRRIIELFT